MRFQRFLAREWRLVALLAGVVAVQTWLVHDMRFLASGLFGGDHAYQLACIRAIAASLNPMASCNVSGALPGYFPLYGTLVAYFARVTAMDPLQAMFVAAVAFRLLSAFVVYRTFRRLFGRPTGFVVACLWVALNPGLIFKYTEFTMAIVLPLFFLTLYRYLERPGSGRALALGIAFTLLGYSHSVGFIGGVAIAGLAIVAGIWMRGGWSGAGREALRALRDVPIFLAAGALTLGYWWRPLFVHHGRTSLHYAEWTSGDLSSNVRRFDWAWRTLRNEFSFDDVPLAVLTILMAIGVVSLIMRRERRFQPAALLVAATFVWMFHYFATVPLLGTHFLPAYVESMHWGNARLYLAAIPVALFFERPSIRPNTGILETLALLAALAGVGTESRSIHDSPDMVGARAEQDAAIPALTKWSTHHLAPGDVALTTNELSFAWSAITGRKTVVTRRGQNDAFLDMDVRNRDAALMLYGHDDTLRVRLLRQYHVRYLFWASNWFASEYAVPAVGDTVAFDPFAYFRNDDYDDQLARAGVDFRHAFTWVDPALRGDDYPRFDLTLITPRNYETLSHPWRPSLDSFLEVAWAYPDTAHPRVAVLRVKLPAAP